MASLKQLTTSTLPLIWLLVLSHGFADAKAILHDDPDDIALLASRNCSSLYNPTPPNCDIYLAPSPIGGWGVFAGRDFDEGEIVELSPRFVPQKKKSCSNANVLYDYTYGFYWDDDINNTSFEVALFGMDMFYNHGDDEDHNVQSTNFGRQPGREPHEVLWSQTLGYVAKRSIRRGEELLTSYGNKWFSKRGIDMLKQQPPSNNNNEASFAQQHEERYCSKAHAGPGFPTMVRHLSSEKSFQMPLQDHPTAVSKQDLQAGQIIEMAPALVLPREQVVDSHWAPSSILWEDWDEGHKDAITSLRDLGAFRLRKCNTTKERYIVSLEDLSIAAVLPIAGNIGLVRKVGRDDGGKRSNCRIDIISAVDDHDGTGDINSAGVVLRLIAAKDIAVGEELRVNLPDSSSWAAKKKLLYALVITGQPIPKFLADPYYSDYNGVADYGENPKRDESATAEL